MYKAAWATFIGIILLVAGAYWYSNMEAQREISATNPDTVARKITPGAPDLGTYAYECDEHVNFTLTIADEVSSVTIRPKSNPEYPQAAILRPIQAPKGKFGLWFSDNDKLLLIGRGISVTLQSKGSSAINCSPVSNPDSRPWNWGD